MAKDPFGSHMEAIRMRNPYGANKCIRMASIWLPNGAFAICVARVSIYLGKITQWRTTLFHSMHAFRAGTA
jgi:hypothetical protein